MTGRNPNMNRQYPNYDKRRTRAEMRRRNDRKRIIFTAILIAVVLIFVVLICMYAFGFRYMKLRADDGYTIRFLGKISDGKPYSGNIYYPGGAKAKVDMENGVVKFVD